MPQAVKTPPEPNIEIILKQDTDYQYETPEGVIWFASLPRGTVLRIPQAWVRDGIPKDLLASEKLFG